MIFFSPNVKHDYSTYLTLSPSPSSPEDKLIGYLFTKAGHRIVQEIISEDNYISQDRLEHALFLHRNTPDQDIDGQSPAEEVYGCNLQEYAPLEPSKHKYVNSENHYVLFLILLFEFLPKDLPLSKKINKNKK